MGDFYTGHGVIDYYKNINHKIKLLQWSEYLISEF